MGKATANQRFQHTAVANAATTSVLILGMILVGTTPAGAQGVIGYGTSFSAVGLSITATPRLRYRNGATISDMTSAPSASVHPVVLKHDVTNSTARAYNEAQKLSPAFGAAAGTILGFGGVTGTPANFSLLYGAAWVGGSAEMSDATIKIMLQTLGFTIGWS